MDQKERYYWLYMFFMLNEQVRQENGYITDLKKRDKNSESPFF